MRHLEEWAWHQLTDSNQQNGSIGENRIGRSVTGLRKRGVETFLRTRVWWHLNTSAEVLSHQVRKAIPLCLFSESLYAMNMAGGSNNVATRGYSCTDFLFAGLICLSPMSGDTSSWQQRPVLSPSPGCGGEESSQPPAGSDYSRPFVMEWVVNPSWTTYVRTSHLCLNLYPSLAEYLGVTAPPPQHVVIDQETHLQHMKLGHGLTSMEPTHLPGVPHHLVSSREDLPMTFGPPVFYLWTRWSSKHLSDLIFLDAVVSAMTQGPSGINRFLSSFLKPQDSESWNKCLNWTAVCIFQNENSFKQKHLQWNIVLS